MSTKVWLSLGLVNRVKVVRVFIGRRVSYLGVWVIGRGIWVCFGPKGKWAYGFYWVLMG